MTGQEQIARGYSISVHQPANATDEYHVLFEPRKPPSAQETVPCEAVAVFQGEDVVVRWVSQPGGSLFAKEEFEQDIRGRVRTLHDWMGRLVPLIQSIKDWAEAIGWTTRLIDKKMDDSQIGKYKAPSLVMQEGTDRILLEPIGRSAPGVEGVVDLYLMPAYDDIASLYYYDGGWHIHYLSSGTTPVANTREIPARPLSRETLEEVLAELKQNAA